MEIRAVSAKPPPQWPPLFSLIEFPARVLCPRCFRPTVCLVRDNRKPGGPQQCLGCSGKETTRRRESWVRGEYVKGKAS